jgi:glycosyltransferase involved in cell wall biosynthesis
LRESLLFDTLEVAPAGRSAPDSTDPTKDHLLTVRPKLSVLMPVYNERATIAEAVRRVLDAELPVDRELIVIDDGSTDGSADVLAGLDHPCVRVLTQPHNRGKGAAVRRGIAASSGDFVLIHDADLEYDPRDWPALLRPALEGHAVAVYGSRFTGERRNMMFWHWVGNRVISLVTNVLYDSTLSDVETCSKLIAGDLAVADPRVGRLRHRPRDHRVPAAFGRSHLRGPHPLLRARAPRGQEDPLV